MLWNTPGYIYASLVQCPMFSCCMLSTLMILNELCQNVIAKSPPSSITTRIGPFSYCHWSISYWKIAWIVLATKVIVLATRMIVLATHVIVLATRMIVLATKMIILATKMIILATKMIVLATRMIVLATHVIVLATRMIVVATVMLEQSSSLSIYAHKIVRKLNDKQTWTNLLWVEALVLNFSVSTFVQLNIYGNLYTQTWW